MGAGAPPTLGLLQPPRDRGARCALGAQRHDLLIGSEAGCAPVIALLLEHRGARLIRRVPRVPLTPHGCSGKRQDGVDPKDAAWRYARLRR